MVEDAFAATATARQRRATLLLLVGVAAKLVSEMLVYASIAITLNTYRHVLPIMQAAAKATKRQASSADKWVGWRGPDGDGGPQDTSSAFYGLGCWQESTPKYTCCMAMPTPRP